MKQVICFVLLSLCLLQPTPVNANFLDVTIGANFWQQAPEGSYGEASDALIEFSSEDNDFTELYLLLEHPFPLLPNFRYANYDISDDTLLTIDKTFILSGQVYPVASSLQTYYKQENTDYTLFYEVFDNQVLEMDLGVTFRSLDSFLKAVNMDELSQQSINRDDHTLSMLYGSAAINLPLLNLTFASETNYHDVYNYDVELSMDIALGMFPIFDPYITLGVKKHRSEINYSNDLYVQQNWQTAFVGVGVAF